MTLKLEEGPVVVLLNQPEIRKQNGTLANPPLMFVAVPDYLHEDCTSLVPIEWGVLNVLAPDLAERLADRLKLERPLPRRGPGVR